MAAFFPDKSSKYIFLKENVWISIKISLKFVPKGPINNIPKLSLMFILWIKIFNYYMLT